MASIEKQLQVIIRDSDHTEDVIEPKNVYLVPLKRPGEDITEEEKQAGILGPTPDAFETSGSRWLKPSVSISGGSSVSDTTGRYEEMIFTIAYYAGPVGGSEACMSLRRAVARALDGQKVYFGDGNGGHVRVLHDYSLPTPSPEFPGAGYQMLERIAVLSVWRRT